MSRIGITTTVPVEIIYAAGHLPVDLNNLFITHENRSALLEKAERHGFPQGVCAWIKGLYAVAESGDVDKVVTVVHGDCANTVALGQVYLHRNIPVVDFAFPHARTRSGIGKSIEDFRQALGADPAKVREWKVRLDRIRGKLITLDELTWRTGQVSGEENHLHLVGASDFGSDPKKFERELEAFLAKAQKRPHKNIDGPRIGVIGVPTALDDLYSVLEDRGAAVVFNEVQRQFAFPDHGDTLVDQYMNYTYPFDLAFRIDDLLRQIALRKIDALVHYIQSFCHRQIEDIVLREKVGVPVLTIEGDRPGPTDGRTLTRIDAFLEMIRGN